MSAYLVTGGAGFIGSHLVDALVARGDKVRVLDDFSVGTHANLSESREAIEVIAADLNAPGVLQEAVRGIDLVFHFMEPACGIAKGHESTPGQWANASDTLNVLLAVRESSVRRVVLASSGGVYGPGTNSRLKESDATMPVSPRGFEKQSAENQCAGFTRLYGLETVGLRFFNVFGPRQSPSTLHASAIPTMLKDMLAGQNPVIAEMPFEQHDFLYVADAVHATLLAAEAARVAGKVFNIARGRSVSLMQVASAANQILGTDLQPVVADFRKPSDLARSIDISRAETELGFCPSYDLKQGLARFLECLQKHANGHSKATPQAWHAGIKEPRGMRWNLPSSLLATRDPVDSSNPDNS